jgi:hypothetical protein
MNNKIERDVKFLKIYAGVATLVIGVLFLTAFQNSGKQKFTEIDVERINVVEKNGNLRMVLANNDRTPDLIASGKVLMTKRNSGGLYLYNDVGEEAGGLVASGKIENGKVEAGSQLSLDQYGQDQTVRMIYEESNGRRRAGLSVQDRSDILEPEYSAKYEEIMKMKRGPERDAAFKPLRAPDRVYIGKTWNNDSAVVLFDREGKARIRLMVDEKGTPKLEFVDANGKVTHSLPTTAAKE